jgi:hypothetical protein
MQITKDFILKNIVLTDNKSYYEINLYSELFQKDVRIWVYSSCGEKEKDISDVTIKSINSFLGLEKTLFTKIKEEIWQHYNLCLKVMSYWSNIEEENRKIFGIHNEDDSMRDAKIDYIYFDDNNDENNLYFSIWFDIPWEIEHGINMFFSNGELISVE